MMDEMNKKIKYYISKEAAELLGHRCKGPFPYRCKSLENLGGKYQ